MLRDRTYRPFSLLGWSVILLLTAGCYGIIGAPPSGNPPTARNTPPTHTPPIARAEVPASTPDASSLPEPSTTPPEGEPIPIARCVVPSANQLRRLTRIEYQNTLRDLLNQTVDVKAKLPPDEQTFGFAVGEGVSLALSQGYMDIAEEVAAKADLDKLLPCKLAEIDDDCAKRFIQDFGLRTYRRPLKPDESGRLFALYTQLKTKYDTAIALRNLLHNLLQSPHFLYRIERGTQTPDGKAVKLNDYEIAARLSYFLWASTPDQALYDAASKGELRTTEQIAAQARRMLQDTKARGTIRDFFNQWLQLDKLDNMSKSDKEYPTFNTQIANDMRAETERFIDYVIWEGDAKLHTLLTARFSFLNERLAQHYGISGVTGPTFQRIDLPATQQRAGLLTQGSFLAIHANKDQSSPIHRGLFVRTHLLCQIPDRHPTISSSKPPTSTPTSPHANALNSIAPIPHVRDATC